MDLDAIDDYIFIDEDASFKEGLFNTLLGINYVMHKAELKENHNRGEEKC